jgi:hypothetical protein
MPTVRAKPGTRCKIPFCKMAVVVKDMCWAHYRRELRGAAVGVSLSVKPGAKRASADRYGCQRPTYQQHRIAMFRWWLSEGMVTPEPTTGCLLWFGRTYNFGYGRIGSSRDPWGGYAHRAALHLAGVELPSGTMDFHVRHICNNPACVSLDHLRLGTAKENASDRTARYQRGELKRPERASVCHRGHVYSVAENGRRWCAECARLNRALAAHPAAA